MLLVSLLVTLAQTAPTTGPYDLTGVDRVVRQELATLQGDATVILRQGGQDLYTFTAGAIAPDSKVRLASLTKTISAGVMLSLVDAGDLALDETLAEGLPLLFGGKDIGEPTILDCWSMRSGLDTRLPYEHLKSYGHLGSVVAIAAQGALEFPPGTELGYNGSGMQAAALVATKRAGLDWEELARERVLGPCGMDDADYGQFGKNPAVAGGLRASALEVMAYADMVLAGGLVGDERVLSDASVERLFTDHTAGLPVHFAPFPASHPGYPYGARPTYGFGDWVLAKDPATDHVEEVVGAGAWGSYVWLDRRRGLSAVLIVDVPAGSKKSIDAALGIFAAARAAVEAGQAGGLTASAGAAGQVDLAWTAAPGADGYRVVGSDQPLLDVFDLGTATTVYEGSATAAAVRASPHLAVLATFAGHENVALVPGSNVTPAP